MNWSRVSVIAKPNDTPVDHATVIQRLDIVRTDQNDMIDAFIKGAVARVDGPDGLGIAMLSQTWRYSLDNFESTISLPGWPVKSVVSVNYRDASGDDQVVDAADYRVDLNSDPVRVVPVNHGSWPVTDQEIGSVWVEYIIGEEAADNVPADLIDAVCLLVGHRYENREASAIGVSVSALPYSVKDIFQAYRRNLVTA